MYQTLKVSRSPKLRSDTNLERYLKQLEHQLHALKGLGNPQPFFNYYVLFTHILLDSRSCSGLIIFWASICWPLYMNSGLILFQDSIWQTNKQYFLIFAYLVASWSLYAILYSRSRTIIFRVSGCVPNFEIKIKMI